MQPICIAPIVEGYGEVKAVPILLHRIVKAVDPSVTLVVPEPIRVPRMKLKRSHELQRAVQLAYGKIGGQGGILILLDSEDDCPAESGPALLRQAQSARTDIPISVVLAHREYETWFIAAAESLRGCISLPSDLSSPGHPEHIRGAKEWLSEHLPRHVRYSETVDQPELTRRFDMQAARRIDSFDKLYREVTNLLTILRAAD